MLQIRSEQMEVFRQSALATFEESLVVHSGEFSPLTCKLLGEDPLRIVVRDGMERAAGYGFTNQGPIRLFIELMFLFGSHFDSDPQYPWAAAALRAAGDQMVRAEELYEQILKYQEHVSEPDPNKTNQSIRGMMDLAQNPRGISPNSFVPDMLREVTRISPRKAEFVGQENLTELTRRGSAEARDHRFPGVQGEILMVMLMFNFGHACARDPLYPWIAQALRDPRFAEPEMRAGQLRKKTLAWFSHALSTSDHGGQQ